MKTVKEMLEDVIKIVDKNIAYMSLEEVEAIKMNAKKHLEVIIERLGKNTKDQH